MNATAQARGQQEGQEETAGERPSAVEINTLLADLKVGQSSVDNKEWLSVELAGEPVVSLSMLGSTASPLSALSNAGLDFLTPMISFLEEPLNQLRGDPDGVSSPSGEFDQAYQDTTGVAEDYGSTAEGETSEWSGDSKSGYSESSSQLIDGITSLAETSLTSAKAMVGAGEVVAQVVDIVTRLITEAVGKIVPIMTEAIAAAAATFGQSIAAAIPQCVQIAVDYAGRIAGKLAALLASGENLIKLLEGATGALEIVKEVMGFIGDQAAGGSSTSSEPADTSDTSDSEVDTMRDNPDISDDASRGEFEKEREASGDESGKDTGELEDPLDGEWIPVKEDA